MITPENQLSKLPPGTKEQILISKYDTFINYIKQLNLHLSVACRNATNYREVLKTLLVQLDKIVDDYNTYVILYKTTTPIYLNLTPLVFAPKTNHQGHEVSHPLIIKNDNFQIHIVFMEWKKKKIKFHAEIWKRTGLFRQTNSTLTKLENLFMREILESVIEEGFLRSNETDLIISHKRQKIPLSNKPNTEDEKTDHFLPFLKKKTEKYLKMITRTFSTMNECELCKKYLMFDSKNVIFEPPIIKVVGSGRIEDKYFHESCCLKHYNSRTRQIR